MTPYPPEHDIADMLALQNGEKPALDRLMLRWQIPLRSFLYRHTQNEFDALDLAQEAFVRVYLHRDRFRTDARFSTWLFQIALNLARDRARRLSRRKTDSLENSPEPVDLARPSDTPEADERALAVRQAIALLPEDLRVAVVLFEYENKSHAEIAAIVGASPKAIETRLYRARQHLHKSLARWLE